jgi:hypothetical protein
MCIAIELPLSTHCRRLLKVCFRPEADVRGSWRLGRIALQDQHDRVWYATSASARFEIEDSFGSRYQSEILNQ